MTINLFILIQLTRWKDQPG